MFHFPNNTTSLSANASSPGGPLCPYQPSSTTTRSLESVFYSLVLVCGVLGNSLVMAIVYRNRAMRTPANYFIANMALADFIVPIFLVPHVLVQIFQGRGTWLVSGAIGLFLCKMVPFIYDVALMVSIHSLVLVALERFYAVMRPMRAAIRSTRRCFTIIAFTWFFACLFHVPYLVNFKVFKIPDRLVCDYSWEPLDNKEMTRRIYVAIFLLFYAFPLTAITALYFLIIYRLKRQRIPGTRYGHMIANRQRRIINTFKMVMTVVLAFFICWTPVKINTVLIIYHWDFKPPCDAIKAEVVLHALAYCNSAITPFIYFVFNENYKNGLRGLLPWYEKPQTIGYPRGHLTQSTNSSLRSAPLTTRVSFKQNSIEQIDPAGLQHMQPAASLH